jgi:hypothetical protein
MAEVLGGVKKRLTVRNKAIKLIYQKIDEIAKQGVVKRRTSNNVMTPQGTSMLLEQVNNGLIVMVTIWSPDKRTYAVAPSFIKRLDDSRSERPEKASFDNLNKIIYDFFRQHLEVTYYGAVVLKSDSVQIDAPPAH